MGEITLDISKTKLQLEDLSSINDELLKAHGNLHNRTGLGKEFIGWIDQALRYDYDEFQRIKETASIIRENSDVFIVVGIGGSYLGARAAIESLTHSFYNQLPRDQRKAPEIYFIGNNISGSYLNELLEIIDGKDISINVISKSGTTTEPAIAFRILKEYMEEKYEKSEVKKRIFATTDKSKGALKELANQEGYETFIIPDDIGGRFSVITPVGLLPIAVAGLDIDSMVEGVKDGVEEYKNEKLDENPCYQYAVVRNLLYRKNKLIEILVGYEPSLFYIGEWWKQLYGESEGKDGKGIFPASVTFSTDLHSLGQYIQEGRRNLFETVINVDKPKSDIRIKANSDNLDNLNYLKGKTMNFVNKKAMEATALAHEDGGVPNIIINVPEMNEYYFGKLIYFFMKACGISGYILGVNPFNQPGVESYKKNMFALLGKPGFEELRNKLNER
ncbi:MAG: glucose-6-phosphate isomerase [Firmicutes bacterium]|nr:glucose-6-phosphate isomerase [Bacillota bacterium]